MMYLAIGVENEESLFQISTFLPQLLTEHVVFGLEEIGNLTRFRHDGVNVCCEQVNGF